jgi:hypothetical protein
MGDTKATMISEISSLLKQNHFCDYHKRENLHPIWLDEELIQHMLL